MVVIPLLCSQQRQLGQMYYFIVMQFQYASYVYNNVVLPLHSFFIIFYANITNLSINQYIPIGQM